MTMITPSYLGETIEYSSLHACRSTLEDPTELAAAVAGAERFRAFAGEDDDFASIRDDPRFAELVQTPDPGSAVAG